MFQLNPASLENEIIEKPILKKNNAKTFKNKKEVNFIDNKTKLTNIADMLSKLNNDDDDEDDNFKKDMNNLKNSVKEDNNKLLKSNKFEPVYNDVYSDMTNNANMENNINSTFSNFSDSYNKSHYDMFNIQNPTTLENNNTLLSKLDYVIHLLEEQHNERTNHITEELILYLFLGIFIIFVLDSFARASKYVR